MLGRRKPALLVLALLVLAGCGVAAPAAAWPEGMPPRNTAISVEPILLDVWLAADYVDQPPIVDLVADFERAYPNIKVKRTGVEWEQMLERVEIAVSQGSPPDLAHAHPYAAAAQGIAQDVNDLWQAWGSESEFMPGALEDVIWQGNVYGVPLDINTLFTIYNRRLFTEN
ncbi:MAG TPA: extracellular solute-binding protein, partial [Herpetosiphonaceae bacterium]|nr:extracellular solute-binding protein [Herpetosiphonaceae bacterium]